MRELLEAHGWEVRHGKGSHYVFRRSAERMVIPLRRGHVLPIYVRIALKATEDDEDGSDG